MRSGFTLPEATMALVILGWAAAGVLLPFSNGAAVQAEGLRLTLAAKLANDLMERIVATTPSQIVFLWDGYAEAQKDAGGVVFSRSVTCSDVYVPQENGPPLPANFVLVSVQASYQGRQMAALSRLVSK